MTAPPPFSPTIALLAIGKQWETAFNDALKPLGLTARKYGLLGHIRSTPGISFSELARRSRITVQSAHTAVASLAEAGLVSDDTAHAGSASSLAVTSAGEALLGEVAVIVSRLDEELTALHPELVGGLRTSLRRGTGLT